MAVIIAAVLAAAAFWTWWKGREPETPWKDAISMQVTSELGSENLPSLSPDGKMVVYSSYASGNWDLYLLRVGGENPINLTQDCTLRDTHPAFSPDGERIAFRSERNGGGIFVMGATGESVRRLTDFGYNPAWSPTGDEILVATEGIWGPSGRETISQIWAVDTQTGATRRITEGDAVQPHWSPEGHRIAYWAVKGGQRDIWTIPAAGGEAVRVTSDPAIDWNPVWSADGSYLYFCSDRGGRMNLWRVPIEERSGELRGKPEAVTTGVSASVWFPSVSGNGHRIAYTSCAWACNVRMVRFNPSEGTAVGEPVWITRGTRDLGRPHLSPDGEWLAYMSRRPQEDIEVIRTDGTGRRRLTHDIHKDRHPHWSPDGKRIAFFSDRGESYEIWAINPDGSGLEQLTDTPGEQTTNVVWSPDGSRMACVFFRERTSVLFDPRKPWDEQTPEPLPPYEEEGILFAALSWSPDGRWLAGELVRADGSDAGLAVYCLETQQFETLTDFRGGYPTWLSDSRRILFGTFDKMFVVDRQTKECEEILSFDGNTIWGLCISPDNERLYFSLEIREEDIWLLSLD